MLYADRKPSMNASTKLNRKNPPDAEEDEEKENRLVIVRVSGYS